jgi:hypothetical protein
LAAALSGMWRHVLTKDLFLYVEKPHRISSIGQNWNVHVHAQICACTCTNRHAHFTYTNFPVFKIGTSHLILELAMLFWIYEGMTVCHRNRIDIILWFLPFKIDSTWPCFLIHGNSFHIILILHGHFM